MVLLTWVFGSPKQLLLYSVTSIRTRTCKWQSVTYAEITLATCSRRNLALTAKVFSNNFCEPSEKYVPLTLKPACLSAFSSTLVFICPDPLPTRLVYGASWWPKLNGHNVKTPEYVPIPSPQASKTTCLPGEDQSRVCVEVWRCEVLYLLPKAIILVLTKSLIQVSRQLSVLLNSSSRAKWRADIRPWANYIFSSVV